MQRQQQAVAQAHQYGGAAEGVPRGGAPGGGRKEQGSGQHRQHVRADDQRDRAGRQAQPVAVGPRVGAGEGGHGRLRAQHRDPEQPGGQLHRPHAPAAQHPDIHQRVLPAQLPADEGHERREPGRQHQPHPSRVGAVDPQERQPRGQQQQCQGQQGEAGPVHPSGPADARVGNTELHRRNARRHGGGGHGQGQDQVPGKDLHQGTGGQCPRNDAELQGSHQQPRGAPGQCGLVRFGGGTAIDQGHFQRQPHHVEALQRPREQEGPEVRGQRHAPRGRGGEDRGDHQDPLVAVQVTQPGQHRHGQRAEHQLRGLEPVHVAVGDPQVPGDVGQDRRVVALQDAAGDLDQGQEQHHRAQPAQAGGGRAHSPPAGRACSSRR